MNAAEREAIEELSAGRAVSLYDLTGRALEIIVVRRFFRWTVIEYLPTRKLYWVSPEQAILWLAQDSYAERLSWDGAEDFTKGDTSLIPRYTTDERAAFAVVSYMRRMGMYYALSGMAVVNGQERHTCHFYDGLKDGADALAHGDTPGEAICRAALLVSACLGAAVEPPRPHGDQIDGRLRDHGDLRLGRPTDI